MLPAFPDVKALTLSESINREKVGVGVCVCVCVRILHASKEKLGGAGYEVSVCYRGKVSL